MKRKAKRIITNSLLIPHKSFKTSVLNHDGFGTSMPPSLHSVEIYFDQKGVIEVAWDFYNEYDLRRWKSATGHLVVNWKVCAAEWIYNYQLETKRKFRMSPFYME